MESTSSQPKRGICPVCLKKVAIDPDAKSVLHCSCGTALFVSPDGRLISSIQQESPEIDADAITVAEPSKGAIALDVGGVQDANPDEERVENEGEGKEPRSRRRRSSSMGLLGLGLVVLVVIGSVVFRMTRSPHSKVAVEPAQVQPATEAAPPEIKPGQFAEWILEAPAPVPPTVSAKPDSSTQEDAETESKQAADNGKGNTVDQPSYRQFAAPSTGRLPEPSSSRPRLKVTREKIRESVFRDAYDVAYDQYETLMSMDNKSKSKDGYRKQLATTLAYTRQAYDALMRRQETKNLSELRYLLAYLSFEAGLLEEAMVYGMWAARLGDAADGSTRDAAFLTLAATQEASEVHWADPNEVGELNQMRDVIQLIEDKWPEEKTDEMWLNLARRYLAFGAVELAANAFQRVPSSSSSKADACFGAGEAYWRLFRLRASPSKAASMKAHQPLLDKARQQFNQGITRLEKDVNQPTRDLMSARFTSIRIAALKANDQQILKLFHQGKFPLATSITARKQHPKGQVTVEPDFCRAVIQMMHDVLKHDGQSDKALITMERLEKMLPAGSEGPDSTNRYRDHFVMEAKAAMATSKVTAATLEGLERDFGRFEKKAAEIPLNDLIWMAQTMGEIGMVAPAKQLAGRCFAMANQIATRAVAAHQPDEGRQRSIQIQQIKWLVASGKTEPAYELIQQVLDKTPSMVDLQVLAAKILEERAIASDSIEQLMSVMDGSGDEESNVWGWSKLAVVLQQARRRGEASDEITQGLLESQFHLARCRWLLARANQESGSTGPWARLLKRQQATFALLIPPDDPVAARWQTAMQNLTLP